MSDKDLIVTIKVPTLADEPAKSGPMHGRIGTGCVVGRGLILTARHVLDVGERRNPDFPIRLCWYALHETDPQGGWRDLGADAEVVVWPEDPGLDVALLRIDAPPDARLAELKPYRLATVRPRDGLAWGGRGFPRSHVTDHREKGDFIGKVMSCGRSDRLFSVTSELKTGKLQRDWSGASGMPVVLDETTVLGVIKSVPKRYDNRELEAVPASLIRADKALSKALGLEPLPDVLERARGLIVDALRPSKAAVKRLAEFLVPDCSEPPEQCLDKLARVALDTPIDRLLEIALRVQTPLRNDGLWQEVDLVSAFIQAVLPTNAESGQVDRVARDAMEQGATLVQLDAHSPTMTEILMAAADRRPTSFRAVHVRNANPIGEAMVGRLFGGGETGRHGDGKQIERDLIAGLQTLFESAIHDDTHQAVFDHLKRSLTHAELQQPPDDEAERQEWEELVAAAIDRALRGEAIRHGHNPDRFTYYVLAEIPSNLSEDKRAHIDRILAGINARFEQIAVVCISQCPLGAAKELKPLRILSNLLYQQPPKETL